MKVADVVLQLKKIIPKYTNLLSTHVEASNISVVSDKVTIETVEENKIKKGDLITISGFNFLNPVAYAKQEEKTFEFTTSVVHDLTMGFQEFVTIRSPDIEVSGVFKLMSVSGRNTFVGFKIEDITPTQEQESYLLEDRADGVNDVFQVSTIIDSRVFEIEGVFRAGRYDKGEAGKVATNIRIAGFAIIDRALEQYTELNEEDFWLFVVPDRVETPRNPVYSNDGIASPSGGEEVRVRLLESFSVYAVTSIKTDPSGIKSIDVCKDQLYFSIMKSLFNLVPDSGLASNEVFRIVSKNHELFNYYRNLLTYRFEFEFSYDAHETDGFTDSPTAAIRKIDYVHEMGTLDTENVTVEEIDPFDGISNPTTKTNSVVSLDIQRKEKQVEQGRKK